MPKTYFSFKSDQSLQQPEIRFHEKIWTSLNERFKNLFEFAVENQIISKTVQLEELKLSLRNFDCKTSRIYCRLTSENFNL